MKACIVQTIDKELVVHEIDADNLIPFMEVRGYMFSKFNDNDRQRAELRGQPKFSGINGPMWNGDGIRYECPETYAALSQD